VCSRATAAIVKVEVMLHPKAGGYGGLGGSSSHHEMRTNAGRNELISNTLQCQKAHGQSGAHGDNSRSGDDGAGCPDQTSDAYDGVQLTAQKTRSSS
jgi:hypothetical protein